MRRRTLLSAAPGAAAVSALGTGGAAAAQPVKDLKITDLKVFLVGKFVFVKVYTSEGITGLGEGTRTNRARTVGAAIEEQKRILIGQDPTDIELLWQRMYRWPRARNGPILTAAVSAIEIALWDILGKLLGVPIYKLLGGAARDRIRLYRHVYGNTPEKIAEATEKAVEAGYTVVRTGLSWQRGETVERPWPLQRAVSLVEAMRDAAGDDVDIIDDAHGMLTPEMALEYAKAIEPYRLMFLEDPVQPDDLEGLEWIGDHTETILAIGESHYTKFGFEPIVTRRLAQYVRPDPILAGGIAECKKIGAMAEARHMKMALHVAPSPVSNLAAAHVAACTPSCTINEISGTPDRRGGWMRDLFGGADVTVRDGYAALPDRPGLGCDLDETIAAKHPHQPSDLPHKQYPDGSVSDW